MCNCRKDLEPGLHISRLGREDFAQFIRLARTMTAFVRIKQVMIALPLHVPRKQAQWATLCTPSLMLVANTAPEHTNLNKPRASQGMTWMMQDITRSLLIGKVLAAQQSAMQLPCCQPCPQETACHATAAWPAKSTNDPIHTHQNGVPVCSGAGR